MLILFNTGFSQTFIILCMFFFFLPWCWKFSKKYDTPFHSLCVIESGLWITERKNSTRFTVITVACRLFGVFGKEESTVVSNLSCSDRIKYFKALFCWDKYTFHNKHVYLTNWYKYCELDTSTWKSFMTSAKDHVDIQWCMHMLGPHNVHPNFLIEKCIVGVIFINNMFHNKDIYRVIWYWILVISVVALDSSEDVADKSDVSWYAITISNTKQFLLVEKYLDSGL